MRHRLLDGGLYDCRTEPPPKEEILLDDNNYVVSNGII